MTNTHAFIAENRHRRVEEVALEIAGRQDIDVPFVLRQIEGWQRMRHKVPRLAATEGIIFPPRIALEQCSGAAAAEYKAAVVSRLLPEGMRKRMIDLTGGMGVDFSFIAPLFHTATYVERMPEIAMTARHNLPLLGIERVEYIVGDGIEVLREWQESASLIFVDPARRDAHGGKTVLIEDCEPDIATHLELLLSHSGLTMVKLSPMLDIHRAVSTLHALRPGCVREVHVFAAEGECKDLLLVLDGRQSTPEPRIFCAEDALQFSFLPSEETTVTDAFCTVPRTFLYEPGPAIMKAGAFRSVGHRYGLQKLHPNSHLYTSDICVDNFPGRVFRVKEVFSFSKSDLRRLSATLTPCGNGKSAPPAANLAIRNFPDSVAKLRARLKLREGGSHYLFATTLADGRKVLILGEACR